MTSVINCAEKRLKSRNCDRRHYEPITFYLLVLKCKQENSEACHPERGTSEGSRFSLQVKILRLRLRMTGTLLEANSRIAVLSFPTVTLAKLECRAS